MRVAVGLGALLMLLRPGETGAQTTINEHPVVLDGQGKLLSWLPQDTAYGAIINRVWDAWLAMPTGTGGRPYWYLYSYMNADFSPATGWPSAPGGQMGMAADAAIHSFPYTGRTDVMASIRAGLEYMIANGSTPTATGSWRGVFYNEACGGATTYNGCSSQGSPGVGDGTGNLEPDKQAELGLAYLWFYMYDPTNTAFRDAAIRVADQLVANRVTATSRQVSPWPFRVRQSNNTIPTSGAGERFCGNTKPYIQFFDLIIRLGLGNTASYQAARDAVWTWATTYQIPNNDWANYFEDQVWSTTFGENQNQLNPGNFGRFLLENPSLTPNYLTWAQGMATWIESNFGNSPTYGAITIDEQYWYMWPMGSHTSRFGALHAWLYAATGNATYKDKAFRALNWATYMNRPDKYSLDGYPFPNQIWMTDGFGDTVRHFAAAMMAVPEWAPAGEDHLLGSTSVVQSVAYSPGRVEYRTFDGAAQEVLRLSFTPGEVLGDGAALPRRGDLIQQGWTFDAATGIVRVRHDGATRIAITAGASPLRITPSAASTPPKGTVAFTASGGSGAGYSWTLSTNASGGSIHPASGVYTAGPTGSVTDVVQISDSLGATATGNVTVTAGVSIVPSTAAVSTAGRIAFTASGGSGSGWTWTLATNASGGTIDAATGAYQAGPTGDVTDVIQVADSLGNVATSSVAVAAPATGAVKAACGCSAGSAGLDVVAWIGLGAMLSRRRPTSRRRRLQAPSGARPRWLTVAGRAALVARVRDARAPPGGAPLAAVVPLVGGGGPSGAPGGSDARPGQDPLDGTGHPIQLDQAGEGAKGVDGAEQHRHRARRHREP